MEDCSLERQLLASAKIGDATAVRRLLRQPALQIDWQDPIDGRTALYAACEDGFTDVARELIAGMARLDIATKSGTNSVWITAANGRVGVARLLASTGVDIDDPSFLHSLDNRSPLSAAAQIGQDEALQWLLQSGGTSRAFTSDSSGWTPIHYACQRGHLSILKQLLDAGVDPNRSVCLDKMIDIRPLICMRGELLTTMTTYTPLQVAAHYGHGPAVRMLLAAGADLFSSIDSVTTTLLMAVVSGRSETVRILLDHIKDCTSAAELSQILITAVLTSSSLGHADVLLQCFTACTDFNSLLSAPSTRNILEYIPAESLAEVQKLALKRQLAACQQQPKFRSEPAFQSTRKLSEDLHDALRRAGFHRRCAATQAALADTLELMLRSRFGAADQQCEIHVVGSVAEGWGGSLACLDGCIEPDSDIDVTTILNSRVFHLNGFCRCPDLLKRRGEVVDYENGHAILSGFAGNPSLPYAGSQLRPAMDKVSAFQCCCYPELRVFSDLGVINFLATEASRLPCHLVPATIPDFQEHNFESSSQLRLSTAFLERYLLRSLTTVQGQVYVTLKYLFKRVLSSRVNGLKSYHAKTILFYMLDELPLEKWTSSCLVELLQLGLNKLLDFLRQTSGNQCMWHFFLPNTIVYLKRNYSDRRLIERAVQDLLKNLTHETRQFIGGLRPCDSLIRFHPFVLHPVLGNCATQPNCGLLQYYEIYDAVSMLLEILAFRRRSHNMLHLCLKIVLSLPKCARTARQCLKVLTYLKFGMLEPAKRAVLSSVNWEVSRGVCLRPYEEAEEAESLRLCILRCLQFNDSFYKFGFRLDNRPSMPFLPEPISHWFPCGIGFYMHQYYFNFSALLKCLTLHLLGDEMDKSIAARWFQQISESTESDLQELLLVLKFCTDEQLLVRLIHRHRRVIYEQHETLSAALELLGRNPDLKRLCVSRSIQNAIEDLKSALTRRSEEGQRNPF